VRPFPPFVCFSGGDCLCSRSGRSYGWASCHRARKHPSGKAWLCFLGGPRSLSHRLRTPPGDRAACPFRARYGDTAHLLEALADDIDAGLVTLPVSDGRLRAEEITRSRSVVYLRKDHPLAEKSAFQPADCMEISQRSLIRADIPELTRCCWNCAKKPASRSRSIRELRTPARCRTL
jgi:hypothetical protein